MRNPILVMTLLASAAAAACTTTAASTDTSTPAPAPSGDGKVTPEPPPEPKTESKVEQAKAAFWKAFYAGRYEDIHAARDLAFAAYEAEPKNPDAARYAWYTQFWRTGEIERLSLPDAAVNQERGRMMKILQEARALNPGDVGFDAWLGGNLVLAGFGRNDPAMLESGSKLLEVTMEKQPLAAGIMTAVAFGEAPTGSPQFDRAVDGMFKAMEWCVGPLDRKNPDMTPHMNKWTTVVPKRACWSNPHTPHMQEGFFLQLGDMLVKQGDVAAARVAYKNVKLTPSFETWREKAALEERLASDLSARAALYKDADEGNDPPLGISNSCVGCHSN